MYPEIKALPRTRELAPERELYLVTTKAISLFCGAGGFAPAQYRERFDLKSDYPMAAPNYVRKRHEVALATGLGRPKKATRRGRKAGARSQAAAQGRDGAEDMIPGRLWTGSTPYEDRAYARSQAAADERGPVARQSRQAPDQRRRAHAGAGRADLPSCLGDEARKEWKRLAKELGDLGLLTRIDRAMLAAYCQAHALWTEAISSIERYGTTVKSPNGYPMQSPYVAVANKQVDIMLRIAAELGMTPSSRTRIRSASGRRRIPSRRSCKAVARCRNGPEPTHVG